MQIFKNASLKPYHTFGIEQFSSFIITVSSVDDVIEIFSNPEWQSLPKLMLGKGSNVLFTERYHGIVMINQMLGVDVQESDDQFSIHVQGGEDWPNLVESLTRQGMAGLENLALIPGCTGSAPVQNIGAYGVEFKDVCDYVDYLDLTTFQVKRLTNAQCQFGYRHSIFKQALKDNAIVIAAGLTLPKRWQPTLEYGPLKSLNKACTAIDVLETITCIRQEKLPDPAVIGSAGSFFKNPVISNAHYSRLKEHYPDIIAYPAEHGVKIAAGWLIDQCGLKGYRIGGAKVHSNQALVIINDNHASSADVIQLAKTICRQVLERYEIELEHEVRFIGSDHEVFLNQLN